MAEAAYKSDERGLLRRGIVIAMLVAIFALLTLPIFIGGAQSDALSIVRGEARAPADLAKSSAIALADQWRFRLEALGPARDGVLDKHIGNAVMAIFRAPLSRGQDAINAVRAALEMQEMIAAAPSGWITP